MARLLLGVLCFVPGLLVQICSLKEQEAEETAQGPPGTQKIKSLSVGGTESTRGMCLDQSTIQKGRACRPCFQVPPGVNGPTE